MAAWQLNAPVQAHLCNILGLRMRCMVRCTVRGGSLQGISSRDGWECAQEQQRYEGQVRELIVSPSIQRSNTRPPSASNGSAQQAGMCCSLRQRHKSETPSSGVAVTRRLLHAAHCFPFAACCLLLQNHSGIAVAVGRGAMRAAACLLRTRLRGDCGYPGGVGMDS